MPAGRPGAVCGCARASPLRQLSGDARRIPEGRATSSRPSVSPWGIARGTAGRQAHEQILAANVDVAFIVTTVDRDFNPRRIERYLSMIWNGGAQPVILLNKVDLTPGLRELRLWDAAPRLGRTFADIDALAARCRFRDCRHRDEPECAVQEALHEGLLDRSHYDNYIKLLKEQEYQRRREDPIMNERTKRRWKSITKDVRRIQKLKGGEE